jgi:hypothetical protein
MSESRQSAPVPAAATPGPPARERPLSPRAARLGFGAANVAVALFLAVGVFRFLPARWWVVDGGALVCGAPLLVSGVALLADHRLAARIARGAAALLLVLGLALFAALVLTASWISGVYGPVGMSGGIVFSLVAALVLPYVVVLPAAELAWLGPAVRAPVREAAPAIDVPADAPPEDVAEARPPAKKKGAARSGNGKGR